MDDCVLVLGAGGFAGQQLVKALVSRGEKVIAAHRRTPDAYVDNVETVVGDLSEPEHFAPLVARSRAVVHVASTSTPGTSAGEAMAELRGNLQPTLALLQTLQKRPQTHLLYVSSGGSLYASDDSHASTEDAELNPRSYHGAGKVAAEFFIRAWAQQFRSKATILRPSNIYGPGQTARPGFGIIPATMEAIRAHRTLPIWGDGSTIRDYLYIDDFVSLCLCALAQPVAPDVAIVNAASGIPTSINDLLATLEEVTGQVLDRHYETRRAVDASRITMNTDLAHRLYGWKHNTDLREGLRRTWEWFNTCQH